MNDRRDYCVYVWEREREGEVTKENKVIEVSVCEG